MMLFDDIERTDAGPARYAEARFAYSNRSAVSWGQVWKPNLTPT